jgi:hypothetical protein
MRETLRMNLGEGNSDTNSPDGGSSDISGEMKQRRVDGRDGSWSHSGRRDHNGFNGCWTVMWKTIGKTTTLVLFLDSLSPKTYVSSCWASLWRTQFGRGYGPVARQTTNTTNTTNTATY